MYQAKFSISLHLSAKSSIDGVRVNMFYKKKFSLEKK